MLKEHVHEKGANSSLWLKAVKRYHDELEENDDSQDIIEVGSLEDLLSHTKTIEQLLPPERNILNLMNRLEARLKFVDDFSAIIALYFGADANVTGLVWGSIRLILTLASSAGDTLQDILDMLEELSFTLPKFRGYENTLPLSRALETALIDVYTEVICFYARAIQFFRTHPHALLRRDAWAEFRKDFGQTVHRIKRLSSIVESEADLARMQQDKISYKEVLDLVESLKDTKIQKAAATPCHHIPLELSPRFWGREEALQAVREALHSGGERQSLKTFALYGIGGVGKTQIALQYAKQSRNIYNTILWVAADNSISIGQSFRDIACSLGLVQNDDEIQDSIKAIVKVKRWLLETESSWLVIFDNADDLEVLRAVWPGNANGSVIITSRDFNAAHSPASTGYHVQPFDDSTGSKILLKLLGLDPTLEIHCNKAIEISQVLGGLPLAINQIGGFIIQRKLPLQDFLSLYERNSNKINSKKTGLSDYEHTISTVWEMSLSNLDGDSYNLLGLLAFFEPDGIHEQVLLEGSRQVDHADFEFLRDEMDLGDAEQELLKTALIDKSNEEPVLSVHRLVQAAVIRRLNQVEHSKFVDVIVRILNWGFPDTWSQDIGHQFQFWTKCEKCLPHVSNLVKQINGYSISPSNSELYGELLLRCSWYLYEREQYDVARRLVDVAIKTFQDHSTLAFASVVDLSGLIDLDMNDPEKALLSFEFALEIRETRLDPDDSLVASSLVNIALAYTEMGELEKAYTTHQKAVDIRLRTQSDRIGNSYSNISSLLLRMGKPDEAEETLMKCPSLKDFTDETFLKSGNPRFSGDMVLLSRIRMKQGKPDDALRLASKALAFRQRILGNRLKTCDSLYDVASLLFERGNEASATDFLKQLVEVSQALSEGEGQLARAWYKLAVLYEKKGMLAESDQCKADALRLRNKLRVQDADMPFEEDSFMKLCLWMLW